MARPLKQAYRCPQLADLARQLVFAPPDRRAEQVKRAERFHDQIDPEVEYPYEFVSYRITGFRSESTHEGLLPGDSLRDDLRLLIDTLSKSAPMPATEDDPVETAEHLASRLRVSTKTIQRWRKLGLRWRWVAPVEPGLAEPRETNDRAAAHSAARRSTKGARPRDTSPMMLVYPRASVERFLSDHADRVGSAAAFSRIEPTIRNRILERATRLARKTDTSLSRIARHLAARTGRGAETIRQMLLKHDREHGGPPLFSNRDVTLTVRERRVIERARRRGVGVTRMADRFDKTRTTIYRVLLQRHLAALRRMPTWFVASPTFSRSDADEVLLREGPLPDPASLRPISPTASRLLAELPEPLRGRFIADGIDAAAQSSLAVRMNYLRFKASKLRAEINRRNPRAGDIKRAERFYADAIAIHQQLVGANLRTLWSIARRHVAGSSAHGITRLLEIMLLGVPVLHAAIDEFDASREHTLESLIAWSLMRAFARPQEKSAEHSRALRRPSSETLAQQIVTALDQYWPAGPRSQPAVSISIDAEQSSIDLPEVLREWSDADR